MKLLPLPTAILLTLILDSQPARAQGGPLSGLYQITSGRYVECCGIAGQPFIFDLPDTRQSFVQLTVNPQSTVATMTFLGADARTVFTTVPCPPAGALSFSFGFGIVLPDRTVFHVDPGPPPYQSYWNYTVSNSPTALRIEGTLGTARSPCVDVPERFTHTNILAVLVRGPRLSVLGFSRDAGARLMIQGDPGWTSVVEASTDLVSWMPISTNLMDRSTCDTCPFVIVQDEASTNHMTRFYRAFESR